MPSQMDHRQRMPEWLHAPLDSKIPQNNVLALYLQYQDNQKYSQ